MQIIKAAFWNPDQRRIRAGWRILAQLGIAAALFALSLTAYSLVEGALARSPLWSSLAVRFVCRSIDVSLPSLCVILSLMLAGRFLDRRPFKAFGFALDRGWWRDLGFGLALGALLMGGIFAVEWLAGWITITGTFQTTASTFGVGIVMGLINFINVGLQEEAMSRGYWLRNLAEGANCRRIGPQRALFIGYGCTSCLFGLLHLWNDNASLVSTFNLILAGLFLGLPYVLTGELALPIGLHITWNFFQGNVFGFPVSGGAPGTSILALQQSGPDLWTGGAFGPEAGLIGILAILVGCGLIVLWINHTRGPLAWRTTLAEYSGSQNNH